MVFVVWAVTPLQNGIFDDSIVKIQHTVELKTSKGLVPLDEQVPRLGNNVLDTSFATLWLGQTMPPYSTPIYALAPFETSEAVGPAGANQTLSAETIMYFTELQCEAPTRISIDLSLGGVSFNDGKGCEAGDMISFPDGQGDQRFAAYYIGYFPDPNVAAHLQSSTCGTEAAHSFLAVWKIAGSDPPNFDDARNATALFCKPAYYTQRAKATVSVPDHTVLSTTKLGPKMELPAEDFNITQFEYLIANGVSPTFNASARQDIIDATILDQDSRLLNMSLSSPGHVLDSMVGFAVGTTQFEPEEYLRPQVLAAAFQSAHQLLFATAVQAVVDIPTGQSPSVGTLVSTTQAAVIEPIFAWLALLFLGLIAVSTFCLIHVTRSRPSKLTQDPDSLAEIMKLSKRADLQHFFMAHDSSDDTELCRAANGVAFALKSDATITDDPPVLTLQSKAKLSSPKAATRDQESPAEKKGAGRPFIQPIEYSPVVGFALCVFLVAIIMSLIFLHCKSGSETGMHHCIKPCGVSSTNLGRFATAITKFSVATDYPQLHSYHPSNDVGALLGSAEQACLFDVSLGGTPERPNFCPTISAVEVHVAATTIYIPPRLGVSTCPSSCSCFDCCTRKFVDSRPQRSVQHGVHIHWSRVAATITLSTHVRNERKYCRCQ